MTTHKKNISLLLDRPGEPLLLPKGDDNDTFDITNRFLPTEYEGNQVVLSNRFDAPTVTLNNYPVPDLKLPMQLPKSAAFSLFIPKHQEYAAYLIDVFLKVPENQLENLLSTAALVREKVNSQLFNYALSVALLHRPDTRDVEIPNFMETFPAKFVDSRFLQDAREEAFTVSENLRQPIVIPREFSGSDLDDEHRVAYFREDIGINLHHWHWHLVYPFMSANLDIVRKDRRGELFYYMHQQLVARYNAERMCNMLGRVQRFHNFSEPIKEGYFPKLDSITAGRPWPPRLANVLWRDLNRPADNITFTVNDMRTWADRIEESISSGLYRTSDGQSRQLTIDILGNMIEATTASPNGDYYGNLHNFGHLLTAYIHDPQHRYLETFGVMADSGTTMRDPFFYRWHAYIDNIFQKFKTSSLCPPYTRSQLINPNISVQSVRVTSAGRTNELTTFWMQSDVNMTRGLDFSNRGPVLLRFSHLNHRQFTYNITINNSGAAKYGTVRIFLAPRDDERGVPFNINEHRIMFMEMDKFVTQLQSGVNNITRNSTQSSVTIPFERTFRDISNMNQGTAQQISEFTFCGCGWPQHMLLPKGTVQGTVYQLFVMVSNYDMDRVDQNIDGVVCADAVSYCGLKDRRYPDRRDMGYPFDRQMNPQFTNIRDFLQSNMFLQEVTIKHNNITEPNPRNPQN